MRYSRAPAVMVHRVAWFIYPASLERVYSCMKWKYILLSPADEADLRDVRLFVCLLHETDRPPPTVFHMFPPPSKTPCEIYACGRGLLSSYLFTLAIDRCNYKRYLGIIDNNTL